MGGSGGRGRDVGAAVGGPRGKYHLTYPYLVEMVDEVRQAGVFSHVRRSVRMTVGQQRVWETNWPELGRKLEDLPTGDLDLNDWFGRDAPVVLEIGSGMGDATAQLAARAPEVNHLAAEVYPAGLGQLMLWVEKAELTNVRLLHGDALDFLRDHLPPDTLAGVRVFFPDPWPKKRHHKRRLITPQFVKLAGVPTAAQRTVASGNGLGRTTRTRCSRSVARNPTSPTSTTSGRRDPSGGRSPSSSHARTREGRICHDLMFTKTSAT